MDQNYIPWIEKYRPRQLEDLTQDKDLMDLFTNTVRTGNMTHFLFYGPPGTSKTSAILAIGREIFKEHFSSRVIEFNASDDRGINAVREQITNEARKYVTEIVTDNYHIPPYKIIILDEADSMTDEAQDALRVIIEQYSTVTRFCFICNYISKITDAIKSRCSAVFFKKLNNQCMISKLNQIASLESMKLPENILDTIVEVSNGDMRKAIMMLHNLKYLYDFKNFKNKSIMSMSIKELKLIKNILPDSETDIGISEKDIYQISSCIDMNRADEIINCALNCPNIVSVAALSKEIVSAGYPIDNVLSQLNKAVLQNRKLDTKQKARIIYYSGPIFLKMKECANEYIQLLDYLAAVNGIMKGNPVYFENN